MTEEEISKCALLEKFPNGAVVYDHLAWYQLRDVYRDYRSGKITKEEGEGIKQSIFKYRRTLITREDMAKQAAKHLADFWARIQCAGNEYAKNPTIDTADAFFEAVYRVGRL